MRMPAAHPGARPSLGGWISFTRRPLRVKSHEMTELEFHISPMSSSSRPQTRGGTVAASLSRRCACPRSSLRR